jgi:hypothetical protein
MDKRVKQNRKVQDLRESLEKVLSQGCSISYMKKWIGLRRDL